METLKMISVIVATYNQGSVLRWLLSSLEQQDYRGEFEAIVCDDGSTDDIQSVVSKFAKRGKLDLRYVWQPHVGNRVTRSRNNGIRCARGEVLAFVDSDCIVPRQWLSAHAKAHVGREKKMVAGTRAWVNSPGDEKRTYPDRDRQIQLARSKIPWAACWAFNMSIPNHREVRFSETLEGWGNDDYELCGRLYHRHDYAVEFKKNLEVRHVAMPKLGSGWNPWVSGKHEHIEMYVRSLIGLMNGFPDVDLSEALWPLHYFLLDQKTGKWRRSRPGEKIGFEKAVAIAENYVRKTARTGK